MKKILSGVVFFVVFILFTLSGHAASVVEDHPIDSSSDIIINEDELARNLDYRKAFSLDQNEENVLRIMKHKEYQNSIEVYGVALSDKELKEMTIRSNLLKEAVAIKKPGKEWSKIFAGVYMDHEHGGVINIGIVDIESNMEITKKIRTYFTNGDRIQFFHANLTEEELENLQERLNELMSRGNLHINYTDISIPNNKVIVGIDHYDEEIIDSILSIDPKNIEVKVDSIKVEDNTRNAKTRPLVGGLAIDHDVGDGYVATCTGAFSAKVWGPTSNQDVHFYITAGHCGDIFSEWKQGGSTIGYMSKRNYEGNSDVGAIEIYSSDSSYKLYEGKSSDLEFSRYQSASDDVVGDNVCMSGRNSGNVCGKIVSRNLSFTQNGVLFTNIRSATFSGMPGDSGAPVFNQQSRDSAHERTIYGVFKGDVTYSDGHKERIYSQVQYIFSDLKINQIIVN
ncbi:S1 family peptidase [Paenibacillus sp. S-12]|uniref:S1 family peptidase n=1 Tax=Paenibacillus sp. S-12 TaxID=3031371 RepID=UPI0025A12308|nr:S1 family peptidase [Paenibacillus sp. S-12]